MTGLGADGPLVIVGAGQAGSMLALYLARQGHMVEVFESRPDLRRIDNDAGRSINLALATRGIVALEQVGMAGLVDDITVPMSGRLIHTEDAVSFQPYGSNGEVISSVSRNDLNAILMNAAEATGLVTFTFDQHCRDVDFDRGRAVFSPYQHESAVTEVGFGTLFGCDGANSLVRDRLLAVNGGSVVEDKLDHGYKELTIPPAAGGGFRLDADVLHIWPRGQLMLIALANPEGDFTATLFMANCGINESFESLDTPAAIQAFFERTFADVPALIPDLVAQFQANPTGRLATLNVNGWSLDHRAVLVGDSAHAIVPFHGQGMNLAMESCRMLDRELRQRPDNVAAAFTTFEEKRKPDADAIATMALDNYVEMRAEVIDPSYLLRRELALELERRHPKRMAARYGMIMFTTMPYAEVLARNVEQQAVFATLTDGVTSMDDIDMERAAHLVHGLGPLPEWV